MFALNDLQSYTKRVNEILNDLIKDVDFGGKIFTYTAYSDGKDYENFKEFLKECYQKHRTIIWY